MGRKHPSEFEGTVTRILRDAKYLVLLENEDEIVAGLCERTRFDRSRMDIGDNVVVRLRSRKDDGACIVYRQNQPSRRVVNTTWL